MDKPDKCKGCPWYDTGYGFIQPYGTCSNKVAIISDYPDLDDIYHKSPLSGGRAGDMMFRTFRKLGQKRDSYGIAYCTHCRPKFSGSKQTKRRDLCEAEGYEEAARHCFEAFLKPALRKWKPDVAVTLGSTASELCTGQPANDRTRGYAYRDTRIGTVCVGSYHPEAVGAGQTGLLFTLAYDLRMALTKCSPDFGADPKNFLIDPPSDRFEEFVDNVIANGNWCVVDIETPYATEDETEYSKIHESYDILRMSFCSDTDLSEAVSISNDLRYSKSVRRLMESGIDIVYWNGDYDDPRLAFNHFNRKGRFVDAMWLWHFLQPDLPKALAHVATYFTDLPEWKSKSSSEPGYYSACDAYATAACYDAILKDLEKHGMLEAADRHVTGLLGILREVIKRGAQTDPKAIEGVRKAAKEKLDAWDDKIRSLYPEEAQKVKLYKRPPRGVKAGSVSDGTTGVLGGKTGRYFVGADGVWGFRFDFNPNAASQIKEYLRVRGIKVPKKHKTSRETTDNKALQRILAQTNDPLIRELLSRAKVAKVYSTYTSWPLDAIDRVHPNFSLNPATGRLACERPNFQNIPKEGEWAELIRRCIIASKGHELVAADYVGMESYLTGYFAEDPVYMKLSTMNIYAYVVAKNQGWELPDESDENALRKALKSYKEKAKAFTQQGETRTLYDKFKCIVLGIGYGEGRDTLFYSNPGLFRDLGEAGRLREFVLQTFPKVRDWQRRIVAQAGHDKKLVNPFGYVRWFHDCPGSDSSRAMAQQPQSTGAAMIKECILQFNKTWLKDYLILQIHDELVWDLPADKVDEAIPLIRSVMSQAWPQLNGHKIAVSMKRGQNLQDMEDI